MPSDDVSALLHPLREICVAQIGITEEDVDNYQINNNNPKMMCYMKCLMNLGHWLKDDGTMDADYILRETHPQILRYIKKAVIECQDIDSEF